MRVITKEKRPSPTPVTVSNDSPPRHKRALTRKEQKQPCQFEWSVKCMFWIMAHYLESSGCSGLLLSSCHHHRLSLSLLYTTYICMLRTSITHTVTYCPVSSCLFLLLPLNFYPHLDLYLPLSRLLFLGQIVSSLRNKPKHPAPCDSQFTCIFHHLYQPHR